MRKLLFAGVVLAAPLLGWQAAHATATVPVTTGTNPVVAPSSAVQKVVWVWVGGRRVWHPYWNYSYWRPAPRWGFGRHWVPGHWAFGRWIPGHYA